MRLTICAVSVFLIFALPAAADTGGRLQWTGAVTQIEGSAGGGLVPWALIGGLETNTEIRRDGVRDLCLDR